MESSHTIGVELSGKGAFHKRFLQIQFGWIIPLLSRPVASAPRQAGQLLPKAQEME